MLRSMRVVGTVLAAVLALLGASAARAQTDSLEYAVKATYLYKFAPFVQWPPGSFASQSSPLALCVIGEGGFVAVLEHAVGGTQIEGRPILVRQLGGPASGTVCHVLYIAGGEPLAVADVLARLRGTPVLTVTDSGRDRRTKGIVNFLTVDNRIRFEIDTQAAAENGLVISSKLLSLAVTVTPRP